MSGEQSDKFLEYCKGKVFLISWKNIAGDIVTDRWITFGEDAVIMINYMKSVYSSDQPVDYCDFTQSTSFNPSGYNVCFAMNDTLDVSTAISVIGEVVTVKCGHGISILKETIAYINKIIGEDNGN